MLTFLFPLGYVWNIIESLLPSSSLTTVLWVKKMLTAYTNTMMALSLSFFCFCIYISLSFSLSLSFFSLFFSISFSLFRKLARFYPSFPSPKIRLFSSRQFSIAQKHSAKIKCAILLQLVSLTLSLSHSFFFTLPISFSLCLSLWYGPPLSLLTKPIFSVFAVSR